MKLTEPPAPSEKQIERSILQYLRAVGIFAFKINTHGVYNAEKKTYLKPMSPFILRGVSDVLGCLKDGRMLAIEIKTPKTKRNVSPEQQRFIDAINREGGIAFVATSVDDVVNKLNETVFQRHLGSHSYGLVCANRLV